MVWHITYLLQGGHTLLVPSCLRVLYGSASVTYFGAGADLKSHFKCLYYYMQCFACDAVLMKGVFTMLQALMCFAQEEDLLEGALWMPYLAFF